MANTAAAVVSWIARELHDRVVAMLETAHLQDTMRSLVIDDAVQLMRRRDSVPALRRL